MKYFLLFTFFLLLLLRASAQEANDDASFFNYTYDKNIISNNKVESVAIASYHKGKPTGKHIFYFDRHAKLYKEVIANAGGKPLRVFMFDADLHGQIIFRKQIDYELKKTDSARYFRKYVDDRLVWDSSVAILPVAAYYFYDKENNVEKKITYDYNGPAYTTRRVTIYKRNEKKLLTAITEQLFDDNSSTTGTLVSDRAILYTASGKIDSENEKIEGPNTWMLNKGTVKYRYDNAGNLVEISYSKAASHYFTYNSNGLIASHRMRIAIKDDILLEDSTYEDTEQYRYTFFK